VYSWPLADEDAVLRETMKHLGEASRRIRTSRHLVQEHELMEDPDYLRLVARLSEALDVTEADRMFAAHGMKVVGPPLDVD
jgi:hypothetical protein